MDKINKIDNLYQYMYEPFHSKTSAKDIQPILELHSLSQISDDI